MTPAALLSLVLSTLTAPRTVAGQLLSARLSAEAVALGLGLVVILNSLVFLLMAGDSPMPPPLDQLAAHPVLFTLAMGGSVAASVFILAGIGRGLGGHATWTGMGVLIGWLQVLRLVMQVAVGLTAGASAGVAFLIVLVGTIWGLWILLNFVDVAHGFQSLTKAALVLILSFLAIILVLSLSMQVFLTPDTNGGLNV